MLEAVCKMQIPKIMHPGMSLMKFTRSPGAAPRQRVAKQMGVITPKQIG